MNVGKWQRIFEKYNDEYGCKHVKQNVHECFKVSDASSVISDE